MHRSFCIFEQNVSIIEEFPPVGIMGTLGSRNGQVLVKIMKRSWRHIHFTNPLALICRWYIGIIHCSCRQLQKIFLAYNTFIHSSMVRSFSFDQRYLMPSRDPYHDNYAILCTNAHTLHDSMHALGDLLLPLDSRGIASSDMVHHFINIRAHDS